MQLLLEDMFYLFAAFYNTRLVANCGGLSSILRNILDCHQLPRINESLLSTVLYLLNQPRTRHYIKADVDLEVN